MARPARPALWGEPGASVRAHPAGAGGGGAGRVLLDLISELSAKLSDAAAARQVGGSERNSSRALIKHSRKKMPVSLRYGKVRVRGVFC